MSQEFPELQKLLQLRAQGGPTDDYFEEFLDEFHRRQRQDLMKRSARSLFLERVTVWLREMGTAKWMYGAGAVYALLMVGFFLWPKEVPARELLHPVSVEYSKEDKVLHLDPKGQQEDGRSQPQEF